MTTITKLAAVAITSLLLTAGFAGSASASLPPEDRVLGLPDAAYFTVNLAHCVPKTHLDVSPAPAGDAAIVRKDVLMGTYGGDCQAFYVNEVLPRLYLSADAS